MSPFPRRGGGRSKNSCLTRPGGFRSIRSPAPRQADAAPAGSTPRVDAGADADFKKPPLHKIATPPFYAARHTPALHDSYTGIRINTSAQVLDLRGEPIPGLYACGDSSGGFGQHDTAAPPPSAASPASMRR
jgi:hypothetical protein